MRYEGRPGLSPAVATLVARGDIRRRHSILDVGCGTGTDLIVLATWGFRRLAGIDPDRGAVGIARRRATRMRLNDRVRFLPVGAEQIPDHFSPGSVDVALHTLVGNNIDADHDDHFGAIARALKPGGLLVACIRTWGYEENLAPGRVPPIEGMARHFALSPGVTTHLAEHGRYLPPYAPVAYWLGRPRPRRGGRERPRKRPSRT